MNQEEDAGKYFIFIGMLIFFLISGVYFVFSLLLGNSYFSIFGNFLNTSVEEPTKIENVRLDESIFVEKNFRELELSNGYRFDVDNLVVGSGNPFVVKSSEASSNKGK